MINSLSHYTRGKKVARTCPKERIWYSNGQPCKKFVYEDDKLNGKSEKWYPNGNICEICTYKDDELHGNYDEMYINGQQSKKCVYVNGKKDGECKIWNNKNKKEQFSIYYFKNGILIGNPEHFE